MNTETRPPHPVPLRQHLTEEEAEQIHSELTAELCSHREEWRLRGCYFIGPAAERCLYLQIEREPHEPPPPELRVKLPERIGGGELVPHIELVRPRLVQSRPVPKGLSAVPQPLAPGSVLLVEGRRGGVALLCKLDGVPHLITCGHLFRSGVIDQPCFVGSTEVARLVGNFLPELDASYCRLTDTGVRLAERSAEAKTWLQRVSDITSDLRSLPVTFYSSSGFTSQPTASRVERERVCQFNFAYPGLWSGLDLCELLMTPPITEPGDSGSLLVCKDLYLGLCTGGGFNGVSEHSYFTPIATIIRALNKRFSEVTLWNP